jgi:hypothetical protein
MLLELFRRSRCASPAARFRPALEQLDERVLPSGLAFGPGLAAPGSLFTVNGSATPTGSGVELTNGGTSEAGSAFSTSPVNITGFSARFSFQILPGSTSVLADGFTFTIQGVGPTALDTAGGGGLGYGPDHVGGTPGIPKSVAIKFDVFNNQGEGSDSTGLYTNGAAPTIPAIDLTSTGVNLQSGDVFNVAVTYNGKTLTVTITDTQTKATATQSYVVNIPKIVGGNQAFVGFTGGTGADSSVQNILSFAFPSSGPAVGNFADGSLAQGGSGSGSGVSGGGLDLSGQAGPALLSAAPVAAVSTQDGHTGGGNLFGADGVTAYLDATTAAQLTGNTAFDGAFLGNVVRP